MKKRLLCLVLALVMILSLNVVAFAGPGSNAGDVDPISLPIEIECLPPTGCPEDCQGQDEDN